MVTKMMQNQPWCAAVAFTAAESTKVIKAAPGAGKSLVVTKIHVSITTAAAQAFDIEDGAGTVEVNKYPASLAVGQYPGPGGLELGIQLTANQTLVYTPAAAGPAGFIIAEGYILTA